MVLIGIDLAWGDRRPDGVCAVKATRRGARIVDLAYPRGDDQLLDVVLSHVPRTGGVFLTVDAPLIIPNRTGSRPVDRLTHALFHREHAGCHPANRGRCPRPLRLMRKFRGMGFQCDWELTRARRMVAEVYPHPALVRFLGLPRIIKYKRGPVAARREEFRRLQSGLRQVLREDFPSLELNDLARTLLERPWTKKTEDLTDALVCALIGLWHWMYGGRRSQTLGDRRSGFILLPEELRVGKGGTVDAPLLRFA
jgi:predicted RNase H-like nuclease